VTAAVRKEKEEEGDLLGNQEGEEGGRTR